MIDKTDSALRSDGPATSSPSPQRPSPNPSPQTASPQVQPAQTAAAKSDAPLAVIGPKIRIKGDLSGDEDILIQGQVDGTIELKEHALTIGENGVIKANAVAKSITIEGKVEGDLFGAENIVIRRSSNVRGNLVSPRVSLEDGAKFRGSIDMEGDPKSKAGSGSGAADTGSKESKSSTSGAQSDSSNVSSNKSKATS